MDNWCVYMHTSPSGKKYIGITGRKPQQRWKNGSGYSRHPYFYAAIKKYSWENFQHTILFDHLTKKEAERLEHLCIALLRTHIKEYGYNMSLGGESGAYGRKMSEEQKQHLKEINKGKKLSKEHKEKLSKAHFGKVLNLSEEEKQKRAEYFMKNNPNKREVYCLETDKVYFSGAEAARKLKLTCDPSNIARCCRGETKSVQGYHFCFIEDKETFDFKEVQTNRKKRKIYCYETKDIYESAAQAARQVLNKSDSSGIIKNCKKQQQSCCGYHFCYLEEMEG